MPSPLSVLKKRLLKRYSARAFFTLVLAVFLAFSLAWSIRTYIVSIVIIEDSTMSPLLPEGTFTLILKNATFGEPLTPGTNVLVNPSFNEYRPMIRTIMAGPGDSLQIARNYYRNKDYSLRLRQDPWFSEPHKVYMPKKGDTLFWKELSPPAFDWARILIKQEYSEWQIDTDVSFWTNEKKIPSEILSTLSLHHKSLGLKQMEALSYQELDMLSAQLKKRFPGQKVYYKRELSYDSATLAPYAVQKDYFFVLARKPDNSIDSRLLGWIARENIIGKLVKYWKTEQKAEK
jgi:signal peptidase I